MKIYKYIAVLSGFAMVGSGSCAVVGVTEIPADVINGNLTAAPTSVVSFTITLSEPVVVLPPVVLPDTEPKDPESLVVGSVISTVKFTSSKEIQGIQYDYNSGLLFGPDGSSVLLDACYFNQLQGIYLCATPTSNYFITDGQSYSENITFRIRTEFTNTSAGQYSGNAHLTLYTL